MTSQTIEYAFVLTMYIILEAEVLYVDYGNRERVKTVYLRKLPESFYAIPMQAICCSLAEVSLSFISSFPLVYREIAVKIFLDLTLVTSVKIPISCSCCLG